MTSSHHHPAVLHAITSCHQLAKSRQHLAHVVQEEALDRAARAATDTRDGLRSQVLGRRHQLGGHADPVAGRIDTTPTGDRAGPMARLADSIDTTIGWLARIVTGGHYDGNLDPLTVIREDLPNLRRPAAAAAHVGRWLVEADDKIRRTLGLLPDHLPVPGNLACPACGLRMLRIVTSAPDSAGWVIVCTNPDCMCSGNRSCRCGMPVQGFGAGHIWDRSTQLVDGLLRQLPRRRVRSGRTVVVDDRGDVEGVAACTSLGYGSAPA
ncbi:hypothetical protein EDC02_5925 [Micromonospora sp. Llam0]|uniref:hypothetical protein n=1 Tax=Micromonospora sp. Llam0 TaxID=2485143 RepID=UPI000F49BC42|nr:hypothetical protein [Micromonospora sp. Llam0]ROO51061.1 hypothetical protein EDC02_5925 [Micromonospora sp. Llam0]